IYSEKITPFQTVQSEILQDFSTTFGRATLSAYVGFVDLAGFSTSVSGKTPDQIAEFLEPFLRDLIGIIRGRRALIDKTIGEEVMFVLPETEEEEDAHETLFLGQLMGGLHDLAFKFNGRYRFRFGLSYGKVRFFNIKGSGYSEWTAVGETVHVAKRLHSLEELSDPRPVIGAFGMQATTDSAVEVKQVMEHRHSFISGFASRFEYRFRDGPVPLKGVGDVMCALLLPRPESVDEEKTG
ncbi:adenylate/guanylate cyclase domain-containing protein, partial [Thermodesulfobacteriota bacterium]